MQRILLESPLGHLSIEGDDQGLSRVDFTEHPFDLEISTTVSPVLEECREQLQAYFAGRLKTFTLKLNPAGTAFQLQIWEYLKSIPYGHTVSYQKIANALQNPNSIRAVGAANGANPVAIIIPCHRVVGSNGSLTGYAGGLWRKKWLLEFESGGLSQSLF